MRGLLFSGIPELFLLSLSFILGDGERFAAILLAALIHEAGHVIAAALLGVKLRLCRTGPAGIALRYDFSVVSHLREAAVCLAGPLLGALCFLCGFRSMSYLAGASAALSLFNLLPISYLDGGCILSALLSSFLSPVNVWRICRVLSVLFTAALWCSAVYLMLVSGGDISAITVSVYLLYRLFSEL